MADAVDVEGVERLRLRRDRLCAGVGVGDELGDHRIVVDRDFAALVDAGVVAHGDAGGGALGRRAILHEAPGRGQEVAIGVLRVDAGLDRRPVERDVGLLDGERLAGGDADHLLDEIDAGDELGHGMLDLQARVHLEEVEALVLPGDELDGAGGVVADRLGERDRLHPHPLAGRGVEQRARRFLDHLLVAALDRAFALAEIDDVAVLVAEHLDLDVAGIDDELLDEHAVVAERGLRLRARARETFRDLVARSRDAHALAAAAGGGLDHHGIADLVGDLHRVALRPRSRRDGRARSRPWPRRRPSCSRSCRPWRRSPSDWGR